MDLRSLYKRVCSVDFYRLVPSPHLLTFHLIMDSLVTEELVCFKFTFTYISGFCLCRPPSFIPLSFPYEYCRHAFSILLLTFLSVILLLNFFTFTLHTVYFSSYKCYEIRKVGRNVGRNKGRKKLWAMLWKTRRK